jgi:hypothetical protein
LIEDTVFISAPSRLDYYKSSVQEVKKIFEESEKINRASNKGIKANEADALKGLKRAKTQH